MKLLLKTRLTKSPPSSVALLITGLLISTVSSASADVVQAKKADSVVDSISVNLHLGYDGSPYDAKFSLLKTRLQEMGIRHYRDGLENPAYKQWVKNRHNEVGRLGIRGTFMADKGDNQRPPMTPTEALQ